MATKEEQLQQAKDAKELLDNPLMVQAFNSILNNGYQQWISTEITDKDTRESLYHKQRAILEVKTDLVKLVENGAIIVKEESNG
tara:strand:- start:1072 stop:1323 length:252 start_codon:yes stop_codon:yes gene_type:complete